jgi:methylated-DNA-[protein]-cysteine S-methyltransferase
MTVLVARCAGRAPAISGHHVDLSEYGRIRQGMGSTLGGVTERVSPRQYGYARTPLGRVLVVTAGGQLVGLHFAGHARTPNVRGHTRGTREPMMMVRDQLQEYFHGDRSRFELPLRLEGTPFQIAVWSALLEIPHGGTSTYGQIAAGLGRPRGARAVGAANGQNPISIVVPCHRLIGADGTLTGYGWGLDRKRRLLELEGADPVTRIAPARSGSGR